MYFENDTDLCYILLDFLAAYSASRSSLILAASVSSPYKNTVKLFIENSNNSKENNNRKISHGRRLYVLDLYKYENTLTDIEKKNIVKNIVAEDHSRVKRYNNISPQIMRSIIHNQFIT